MAEAAFGKQCTSPDFCSFPAYHHYTVEPIGFAANGNLVLNGQFSDIAPNHVTPGLQWFVMPP